MKTLSKDVRYPSCYQCLPFDGQHVLFDSQSGSPVERASMTRRWQPTTISMRPDLAAATAVQGKLNFSSRPPSVDYDLISGGSHSTDNALNFNALAYLGAPNWSKRGWHNPLTRVLMCLPTPRSHPGVVIDVLKTYPFRQILYSIPAATA